MVKIKDLDLMKNIDILFENEIILYGAGNYGRKASELLENINISILGFCDSNVAKWGEAVGAYKVMSLYEMNDIIKEKNPIVIITMADPNAVEQVLGVLERNGLEEVSCYTYFALKHTVELHIDDSRIEEAYREEEKLMKKMFREWLASTTEWNMLSMIWRTLTTDDTVLILQMGKVGSSTVKSSLIEIDVPCFQAHTITGKWGWTTFESGEAGRKLLSKVKKIKIISLIRDPIARGIARYFQGFLEYIVQEETVTTNVYEDVKRLLEAETKKGNYGDAFEWFNAEIKEPFGLDVYEYEFDKKRGFQMIQKDNVELLLIKLEKLDECAEIIGQFVGNDNFKLIKSNVGKDKLYRFAYEELKRTIEIPQNILNFYYKDNPAMDHFYTAEEKEQFYRKWLKKEIYYSE